MTVLRNIFNSSTINEIRNAYRERRNLPESNDFSARSLIGQWIIQQGFPDGIYTDQEKLDSYDFIGKTSLFVPSSLDCTLSVFLSKYGYSTIPYFYGANNRETFDANHVDFYFDLYRYCKLARNAWRRIGDVIGETPTSYTVRWESQIRYGLIPALKNPQHRVRIYARDQYTSENLFILYTGDRAAFELEVPKIYYHPQMDVVDNIQFDNCN